MPLTSDLIRSAQISLGTSVDLRVHPDTRASALQAARIGYDEIRARAAAGDEEAQAEIDRLLRDPEALHELESDRVALLLCLSGESFARAVRSNSYGYSELGQLYEAIVQGRAPSATAKPHIASELLTLAIESQDVTVLRRLSETADALVSVRAFEYEGHFCIEALGRATVWPPFEANRWLELTGSLCDAVREWLARSDKFPSAVRWLPEVSRRLDGLIALRTSVEAAELNNDLQRLFQPPVVDLRIWYRQVLHVTRRANRWLQSNPNHSVAVEMQERVQLAEDHGVRWGSLYRAEMPPRFQPMFSGLPRATSMRGTAVPTTSTQLPTAPTCVHCRSWLPQDGRFCPSCGGRR